MAEGGYDPTTENETPWEDHGIDHDDDDEVWNVNLEVPVDPEETQPFEPGASSTPYHEGEAHEMANMGEEGEGIPLLPKYEDFIEDKDTLVNRFKAFIKAKRPTVDFKRIVVSLGKQKGNQGKAVALGPKGDETVIFKQDNTFTAKFSQQYSDALGPSAENIIVEDREGLAETNQRLKEAEQQEQRFNKTVERQHQALRGVVELRNQLDQINQRITKIENEGGTVLERQNETDRLKRQAEKIKRDIEEANNKEKEYAQTVKERDKAARDVARLQRKYDAKKQKLAAEEARLNRTKPLDELETEREDLKRKIKEDMETMYDENASLAQKSEATARFEARTAELERLDPQIQEREQALPLRERVKNIFKKYGWTLQAVALAVGIVLSALALAATNGLKAGTKALGNGLKTIGQKLGSLLPGLIGSIVSYIFKAAGSVLSFLGEHAWLLILAVVAFFMERLLKKRRR